MLYIRLQHIAMHIYTFLYLCSMNIWVKKVREKKLNKNYLKKGHWNLTFWKINFLSLTFYFILKKFHIKIFKCFFFIKIINRVIILLSISLLYNKMLRIGRKKSESNYCSPQKSSIRKTYSDYLISWKKKLNRFLVKNVICWLFGPLRSPMIKLK